MAIQVEGAVTLLLVYDVPASLRFYRDALGFEVVRNSQPFDDVPDNFGWCLLRLGNVELMLNNMYENNVRPATPDRKRSNFHQDVTIYIDCTDVDHAYAELKAKGIAVGDPVDTYYAMRQVHLTDPDGYSLVFQRTLD